MRTFTQSRRVLISALAKKPFAVGLHTRIAVARGVRIDGSSLMTAQERRRAEGHLQSWRRGFSAEASADAEGDDAKPACSPKVLELAEQISLLNLVEVAELVTQLKTTLNLPDTPAMGMPMGMPMAMPGGAAPAAEATEEAPAAEEKAIVNIQLDSFDDSSKIKVIKEVKALSGLGLKEAKALVESLPAAVLSDVKREDAASIVETLEGVGAKVSLV